MHDRVLARRRAHTSRRSASCLCLACCASPGDSIAYGQVPAMTRTAAGVGCVQCAESLTPKGFVPMFQQGRQGCRGLDAGPPRAQARRRTRRWRRSWARARPPSARSTAACAPTGTAGARRSTSPAAAAIWARSAARPRPRACMTWPPSGARAGRGSRPCRVSKTDWPWQAWSQACRPRSVS